MEGDNLDNDNGFQVKYKPSDRNVGECLLLKRKKNPDEMA